MPRLVTLLSALALAAILLAPAVRAQSVCARLLATHSTHAGQLDDESSPDTTRIQSALNACPLGQTVQLSADLSSTASLTAFLTAPFTLPAGITLSLDPGVTLFASLDPSDYRCTRRGCNPLLTIPAAAAPSPATLTGFGILDARANQPLTNSRQTWLAQTQRPTLILAQSPLTLSNITLRNSPGTTLESSAPLTLTNTHLAGSPLAPGTRGLILTEPATLTDSTLTTAGPALTTQAFLQTRNIILYAQHCILNGSVTCQPGQLPLYSGALFLTPNKLNAVLIAPDSTTPLPSGNITFSEGTTLLATAPLDESSSSYAHVPLPTLAPGHHLLIAAFNSVPFATLPLDVPATTQQQAPTLTLTADTLTLAPGSRLTLTASLSNPTCTGTITFLSGPNTLATLPIASGIAALSLTALPPGSANLTATYSGDSADTPATSNPLTLAIPGTTAPFTLTAAPASPSVNSPILLTAQGLPPAASGFITFTDNAVPIATVPITGTSTPTYQAFGDSITYGFTLLDPSLAYPYLLARAQGLAITDFGVPGYITCNILPLTILPHAISTISLSSLTIGTNDADDFSTGPYEFIFRTCHQATLAWLAIPPAYKLLPTDPAFQTTAGSWTQPSPTHYQTLFNSSGSGALHLTLTSAGAPIYLWYLLDDLNPGAFTLTLDGTPTHTTYQSSPIPAIGGPRTPVGFALLRFPVPAGVHTLDLNVLSGSVGILAAATAPSPGPASPHPTVLSADVPNQRADGAASPATLAQYTADAQADVTLLAEDGLDLRPVVTRSTMLGTPAEMSDNIHPNALGHTELAAAFALPLGQQSLTPYSTFKSTAPLQATTIPTTNGPHTYAATYSGDSTYALTAAPPVTLDIQGLPSTTTLAASASSALATAPVTLTAQLTPAIATGTVIFLDVATPIGSATLINGLASLTLSTLPTGPHLIHAAYAGDTTFSSSQSPALGVSVTPNQPILALVAPSSLPFASPANLTATILPSSASGMVTFTDNGTLAGEATLVHGAASLTLPTPVTGIHTLIATYTGDPNDFPATSSPTLLNVGVLPTYTTLASTPSSSPYATSIPLTATVSPATATGSFTFTDSLTGTLATLPIRNGQATLQAPASLIPGLHLFTASYSGDLNHTASSSSPQSTLIVPRTSTIVLTPIPAQLPLETPIILTASVPNGTGPITFTDRNSGPLGQATLTAGQATLTISTLAPGPHTFNAQFPGTPTDEPSSSAPISTEITLLHPTLTLSAPSPSTPYASPLTITATIAASGPIFFRDSTAGSLGQANLQSGRATLNLPTSLPVGPHTLTASFPGDASNSPTTSQPILLTITPTPTSANLTLAQTTVQAGSPLSFNTSASSTTPPTGTLTLTATSPAGKQLTLGTLTLASPSASTAYATLTIDSTPLGLGTYTHVIASYPGDPTHLPTSSPATTFTLTPIPTSTALILPTTQFTGDPNTLLAATLTSAIGLPPTGTVTFLSGQTPVATVPVDPSGHASITFPVSALNRYTLSAAYTPTGLFAPSASAPATLALTPPLALSLAPATLSLRAGASASTLLTLAPLSGFSGPIAVTCQSPSTYLTCTLKAPATLTATSSMPVTLTLAQSLAQTTRPNLFGLAGTASLALLLPFLSRKRRRSLSALVLLAVTLTGCAPNSGTFFDIPTGTNIVQIQVKAANSTQTATLTVNVAP